MAGQARFLLYVKAGQDGISVGDCPFSHRVAMVAKMAIKPQLLEIVPVNTTEKPESFLKLNPEGKVPVLVDREQGNKVVADSGEIAKYLNDVSPNPCLQIMYSGPGAEAVSGIFPKFAAMMKNKDPAKDAELKDALTSELAKLNTYLAENRKSEDQLLLCQDLCELDCQILPKLRHVQVAGSYFKQYEIPQNFTALKDYIRCGETNTPFKETCPPDKEIIWGWSKFFS